MKLSEWKNAYKDSLGKIKSILNKHNRNNFNRIFKDILDAFPGQEPTHQQFTEAYHTEITARQLLRALHPKKSSQESQSQRLPSKKNVKYGNRKDPLEVRYPKRKINNWRDNYSDPTYILMDSIGDVKLCNMIDKETQGIYEATGNMLFVLKAFFHRVDQLTGGLSEAELQNAKPKEKAYALFDGGGLYLLVQPDGRKQWYFEITLKVKSRKTSVEIPDWHVETRIDKRRSKQIGDYPEFSLHYARRYREAAKLLLAKRKYPFSNKNDIEAIIDGINDYEKDVPIQAWMAQALADGFKHYYSRRILSRKQDTTLDAVFGIESKKRFDEFSDFSIDNSKLVDEARNIQWHCNLKFAPALEFALQKIKLEQTARGDNFNGQELYRFTHAKLKTICADESRGKYGSYGAWHKAKEFGFLAPNSLREGFLEIIAAYDECCKTTLKAEIETAMKDLQKRHFKKATPSSR